MRLLEGSLKNVSLSSNSPNNSIASELCLLMGILVLSTQLLLVVLWLPCKVDNLLLLPRIIFQTFFRHMNCFIFSSFSLAVALHTYLAQGIRITGLRHKTMYLYSKF